MGRMMNVRQAAERLALSTKMVYRLTKKGVIPSKRFGSALRIDENDLEVYIASSSAPRAASPPPPPPPKMPRYRDRGFRREEGKRKPASRK